MPILEYNAHLESVIYLDWHPSQQDVLLSGGQDKTIKVWNIKEMNNLNSLKNVMKPIY